MAARVPRHFLSAPACVIWKALPTWPDLTDSVWGAWLTCCVCLQMPLSKFVCFFLPVGFFCFILPVGFFVLLFCRDGGLLWQWLCLSDEASQWLEGTIGPSPSTSSSPWAVLGEFMSTRHTCLDSGRGVTCTFWLVTCAPQAEPGGQFWNEIFFFLRQRIVWTVELAWSNSDHGTCQYRQSGI